LILLHAIFCACFCHLQHVPGNPWRTVHDTAHSFFHSPDLNGGPSNLIGDNHNHRIRNKSRFSSTSSDDAGVVEGEVHFMMVPWSNADTSERVKFKIMGVNTC